MRVSFSADVLADEVHFVHLDQIIYAIDRGLHEWQVDDPDAIEQSEWLRRGRPSLRTLLEKAAMVPTPRTPRRLHSMQLLVVAMDAPPRALSPAKAAEFIRTPLKVLMENRFTDGVFLDAVLSALADPEVIRLKEELRALVYDSPGGNGELKKLVEDAHAEAQRAGMPLRVVVFTDSDDVRAGKMSDNAKRVRDTCNSLGVPSLVLSKRTIENYIPDEVILEWRSEPAQTSARPRIDAFLRLVGEQRDHFPVKKGFNNKPLSQEEKDLYKSGMPHPPLPTLDEAELQRGFGVDFIHIFFVKDVNNKFVTTGNGAKLPRASLTAAAMRKRDGSGELDQLVAMIEELL